MQKKIIALAIAGLASSAAFAQSNVTLYGIADASLVGTTYMGKSATQTQYSVNSGALSTSRIGFKGVEDLGGGLKALFVLEYGLGIDASNPVGYSTTSSAVARQQMVGLTGGFGTVVAGHLQTTGLDFVVASSALGGSSTLGAVNVANAGNIDNSNLISAVAGGRQSNAIAYISPNFAGVTLAYNHARVSESAGSTDTTDNHGDLVSASYENGPITAGAIYAKTTLIGADNRGEWGLRAGYDFKVAKLQAAYQRAKFENDIGADSRWVVSATVPVGAKVGVIAEYASVNVKSTTADDNVKAATLAATYSLSKRTTAYAGVVGKRIQNGTDTNTYAVGLRHSF